MQTGQRVAAAGMLVSGALAALKITAGIQGHSTSVVADGLESAGDVFSSGFVLLGLTLAAKPADADHPYGHRKYETVAAAGVTVFLLLVVVEVLRNAANRLSGRAVPHEIGVASFVVMVVTVLVNLWVIRYESKEAERLGSELLLADATQTRGDVWTSSAS